MSKSTRQQRKKAKGPNPRANGRHPPAPAKAIAAEPKRARKVMIATPTKSGDVTCYHALALAHSMHIAGRVGIDLYPEYMPHDNFIHHARNKLLKNMLAQQCDDIIFADADNDWAPEWPFVLLSHRVDVVGGTYPRKQDIEHYELISAANPIRRCPTTGLLIVDALGGGFLRLSRNAVQTLWNASPAYRWMTHDLRLMCDVPIINGLAHNEDVTLCQNLARLGFATYLDDRMTCGHIGPKRWKGDVRPWLERVQREVAPYPQRSPQTDLAGLTVAPLPSPDAS